MTRKRRPSLSSLKEADSGGSHPQLPEAPAIFGRCDDVPAENAAALEDFAQEYQSKAAEFEAATKSRSEELEALAKANLREDRRR